jgi:hypothetical protein
VDPAPRDRLLDTHREVEADVPRRRVTFLFDDDVPDDLSHLLKHVGHRVTFLREVLPRNTPDNIKFA